MCKLKSLQIQSIFGKNDFVHICMGNKFKHCKSRLAFIIQQLKRQLKDHWTLMLWRSMLSQGKSCPAWMIFKAYVVKMFFKENIKGPFNIQHPRQSTNAIGPPQLTYWGK